MNPRATAAREEVERYVFSAFCCREWPVLLGARVGRCGYCGRVPIVSVS